MIASLEFANIGSILVNLSCSICISFCVVCSSFLRLKTEVISPLMFSFDVTNTRPKKPYAKAYANVLKYVANPMPTPIPAEAKHAMSNRDMRLDVSLLLRYKHADATIATAVIVWTTGGRNVVAGTGTNIKTIDAATTKRNTLNVLSKFFSFKRLDTTTIKTAAIIGTIPHVMPSYDRRFSHPMSIKI
jgi:hypothetical protein